LYLLRVLFAIEWCEMIVYIEVESIFYEVTAVFIKKLYRKDPKKLKDWPLPRPKS
jgi:hypothetical protein